MTVLLKFPGIVAGRTSREQKMIALRYIIHVVGDIHQPLHVGNGIDLGGNTCEVVWNDPHSGEIETTNLHTVWDETIVEYLRKSRKAASTSKRYFGYDAFADEILARHGEVLARKSEWSRIDFSQWLADSQSLRISSVYPDTSEVSDSGRAYCAIRGVRAKVSPEERPQLGKEYAESKLPIIEKQILIGGLRLASLLNDLFAGKKTRGKTDTEILKSLDLKH
jgi:hypothetical protein